MSESKRVFLSSPSMGGGEQKYIAKAFDTNWIAPLGANVDEFEDVVARYVGASSALALNSGTAALHLGLKALGVQRGDIVFCSDLTFAASCNPICYEGATPVFIDCEPESWNMSPAALERAFEDHDPKAVVVVHLYGEPANMAAIKELCDARGVPVLEDAAESLGATVGGRHTGTVGMLGVYSFNGNKIITTSGGGMLVSDEGVLIDKARFWSTQARDKALHYQHSELGYNYRLSNVCAGIGLGQMEVLEDHIARKRDIRDAYAAAFAGNGQVALNPVDVYGLGNRWLTCLSVDPQSGVAPLDVIEALAKENIESRPIWKPMSLQPYYEKCPAYSHDGGERFVGWRIFEHGLCLPSDINMSEEDLGRVVDVVSRLFS